MVALAPRHEEEPHASARVVDDTPGNIGVALSGGGVRAALYSLGVLLYLVRSGLNRRVVVVTSVSGGSITNAAVAAAGDFKKLTADEFNPVCERLASQLAKQSSFFLPRYYSFVFFGLYGGVYFAFVNWVEGGSVGAVVRNFVLGAIAILFAYVLSVIVYRRTAQQQIFGRIIRAVAPAESRTPAHPLGKGGGLCDLPPSDVLHVLCSTELISGKPMFFSRAWVYSPCFGWGEPNVDTKVAVYASAAFPAVFPPLRLRTSSLKMGGGSTNHDRPKWLVLADGGVYNNLGTDWFKMAESASDVPFGVDARFGRPPKVDYQIIVNASAPARLDELRGLRLFRNAIAIARIMGVLEQSTLSTRLDRLDAASHSTTTLLDISKSPLTAAKDAVDAESNDRANERATALWNRLGQLEDKYWDELASDTSRVKTALTAVGPEQAARLMRHGYLSAMISLHIQFGLAGLDDVPDERAFIGYADTALGSGRKLARRIRNIPRP
jgi:predicted acylesterase/phospholipase RssA